jgi:hypothetical protein
MPRKPCKARIEASEARTFGLRSSAKVTAFLQAVTKGRPAFCDSLRCGVSAFYHDLENERKTEALSCMIYTAQSAAGEADGPGRRRGKSLWRKSPKDRGKEMNNLEEKRQPQGRKNG